MGQANPENRMTGHPSKKRRHAAVTHIGRTTVHVTVDSGQKHIFMRGDSNFPTKVKQGQSVDLVWHSKKWHVEVKSENS